MTVPVIMITTFFMILTSQTTLFFCNCFTNYTKFLAKPQEKQKIRLPCGIADVKKPVQLGLWWEELRQSLVARSDLHLGCVLRNPVLVSYQLFINRYALISSATLQA